MVVFVKHRWNRFWAIILVCWTQSRRIWTCSIVPTKLLITLNKKWMFFFCCFIRWFIGKKMLCRNKLIIYFHLTTCTIPTCQLNRSKINSSSKSCISLLILNSFHKIKKFNFLIQYF